MKIKVLNRGIEVLPNMMDIGEFQAFREAIAMYNPITGPIRSLCFQLNSPSGVPVYCGTGYHSDLFKLTRKKLSLSFVPAAGKGSRLPHAFAGTLGESIERIIPLLSERFLRKRIVYGSARDMRAQGFRIVGPESLHLFAKEQFQQASLIFKPFTEDTYLGWIDGEHILTREKIFAPAQFVLFGYKPAKGETPICYASSGGLTSHVNIMAAQYHGLCEFIERDQINIRWSCGLPPKEILLTKEEIDAGLIPPGFFYLFENPHVRTRIFHWSIDFLGFHVVSVHCVMPGFNKLKYLPGVGADVTLYGALQKAFAEVAQAEKTFFFITIPAAGKMPPMMEISPDATYEEITDLFKTIAYYGYDKNLKKIESFYEGSERIPLQTIQEFDQTLPLAAKYQSLLRLLEEQRLTPLTFDLTPPYFEKLRLQRSIIPELTTYFMIPPFFGHPRFSLLPQQLGLADRPLTFQDLRKSTIPFP